MNNNLQRMIVIPPDVFDKWKHIITEDEKLTQLDKKMKNIIYNKHLNDIDKWHQYRENLLKYSFANKGNDVLKHAVKTITSEKSIQTNRIPKFYKTQQTNEKFETHTPNVINQESQTDEVQKSENIDEVFETRNNSFSEDTELDTDDDTRKLALEGLPKNIRITKERRSTDPSLYKSFELSNGDVVTVPTKITTRSMKKSADSKNKKSKSPSKLKQQELQFLKVKAPYRKPRTNSGKVIKTSSISPLKTANLIKWDKF